MFQSNTSKEILYIFLWLVGIVFVYALVHSFLLEPSQTKTSTKHDIHSASNTVKKASIIHNSSSSHIKIPDVTKVESVTSSIVSPKTIKPQAVVHETIKEPKTDIPQNAAKAPTEEKASLIHNSSSSHIKIPDVPTVTKVESATSSIVLPKTIKPQAVVHETIKEPKVPTVENTVSSSTKQDNTAINLPSIPSVPSIPSIKKVKDMELLDTATKHVNELVKTPQDKVLETIK